MIDRLDCTFEKVKGHKKLALKDEIESTQDSIRNTKKEVDTAKQKNIDLETIYNILCKNEYHCQR